MFRKYECGCIGFSTNGMDLDISKHRVRCVYSCDDSHGREYSIYERHNLAEKPSRKITDDEIEQLLDTLSQLVDDGYAMRELRTALAVAGITVGR